MKSAEHYLTEAAAALEAARVQTTSPAMMEAHTRRAAVLLKLHAALLEREAAGLAPAEPAPPVAVEDAHGRTWNYVESGVYAGMYTCRTVGEVFGAARGPQALTAEFGPLRLVGVANR